jgi:hypothetical protein
LARLPARFLSKYEQHVACIDDDHARDETFCRVSILKSDDWILAQGTEYIVLLSHADLPRFTSPIVALEMILPKANHAEV